VTDLPEDDPTDTRTSEELLAAHRLECKDEESPWDALWALRHRGGSTELAMGQRLVQSEEPADREIGANLLGQLGGTASSVYGVSVAMDTVGESMREKLAIAEL